MNIAPWLAEFGRHVVAVFVSMVLVALYYLWLRAKAAREPTSKAG